MERNGSLPLEAPVKMITFCFVSAIVIGSTFFSVKHVRKEIIYSASMCVILLIMDVAIAMEVLL